MYNNILGTGRYSAYNATAAPGTMKKGTGGYNPTGQQYGAQGSQNGGLYNGNTTGGQEAANYATNLNRNGISNLYVGNTTGGQEAYNYARNLDILHSGMNATQLSNMQNVIPFAQGGGAPDGRDPRITWGQNFLASHRPPSATQTGTPPVTAPPASGPPGGSGSGGDIGQVGTTITPQQLFSPADTAARLSAQAASFDNNPNFLMKQFSKPGRSNDIGTLSLTMPQMAAAGAGMANAIQQVPFEDAMANNQFLLQGQQAQGQQGLGMANLLRQLQGSNDYANNSTMQALIGLL